MSAVLKSVASAASKIVSPGFYVQQYHVAINFTRLADKNGNAIKPFFIGMTLVGLTGYSMEYLVVGRHHVTAKRDIIRKALADHHH